MKGRAMVVSGHGIGMKEILELIKTLKSMDPKAADAAITSTLKDDNLPDDFKDEIRKMLKDNNLNPSEE